MSVHRCRIYQMLKLVIMVKLNLSLTLLLFLPFDILNTFKNEGEELLKEDHRSLGRDLPLHSIPSYSCKVAYYSSLLCPKIVERDSSAHSNERYLKSLSLFSADQRQKSTLVDPTTWPGEWRLFWLLGVTPSWLSTLRTYWSRCLVQLIWSSGWFQFFYLALNRLLCSLSLACKTWNLIKL